jgi:peroxiredoxin
MLRGFITVAATLLLANAALAAPTIGQPAPDFSAVDALTGKTVRLADLKGKIVVLESTNAGCPFVKKFYSVGAMQKLQETSAADGVVWVTLNASAKGKEGYVATAADAQKIVQESKARPTYYIRDPEGKLGRLYDAKVTPHMYVIDKAGLLVYMGAIDDKPTADSADIASATNYVTQALKSLKDGTPIKTTQTKPYGCSVKY